MNTINGIEGGVDPKNLIEIPDGRYLTVLDYARTHGVSRPTVYKLIASGKVFAVKVGKTTIVLEEKPWGCTEVGGVHQPLYGEDIPM